MAQWIRSSAIMRRAEISRRVEEILNMPQIKDWTSEPYNKNLNFAERVWRDVTKRKTEYTLDFSNAPAFVHGSSRWNVCASSQTTQHMSAWDGERLPSGCWVTRLTSPSYSSSHSGNPCTMQSMKHPFLETPDEASGEICWNRRCGRSDGDL